MGVRSSPLQDGELREVCVELVKGACERCPGSWLWGGDACGGVWCRGSGGVCFPLGFGALVMGVSAGIGNGSKD
eukprot:6476676-Amphidinium_carterae.2